jgi:hypothetical protein
MYTTEFLTTQIAATETLIGIYTEALTVLGSSNAPISHTIDTGQTRTTVTRADVGMITRTLDTLIARLGQYNSWLNGGRVIIALPGF